MREGSQQEAERARSWSPAQQSWRTTSRRQTLFRPIQVSNRPGQPASYAKLRAGTQKSTSDELVSGTKRHSLSSASPAVEYAANTARCESTASFWSRLSRTASTSAEVRMRRLRSDIVRGVVESARAMGVERGERRTEERRGSDMRREVDLDVRGLYGGRQAVVSSRQCLLTG